MTPRRLHLASLLAALALALGACGGGDPAGGGGAGGWTWVSVPGTACSDGSGTGIGVSQGTGPDLVIYLEGGGACSSGFTCFTQRTAVLGPFGAADLSGAVNRPGSLFDRQLPGNPFATATLVYVPYCTGDVHGGTEVVTYTDVAGTIHHVGHANVVADVAYLAANVAAPRRLVVTGSSAGGFGALVNYPTFRAAWPQATAFLVDDSGPLLQSDGGALIQAGLQKWGIDAVMAPVCGGANGCDADLSRAITGLAAAYPQDRMALLSWSSDPVITFFYGLGATSQFTTMLGSLEAQVLAPTPNFRAFIPGGSGHTMLRAPGLVSQGGVTLAAWLTEQVEGSAAWGTVKP